MKEIERRLYQLGDVGSVNSDDDNMHFNTGSAIAVQMSVYSAPSVTTNHCEAEGDHELQMGERLLAEEERLNPCRTQWLDMCLTASVIAIVQLLKKVSWYVGYFLETCWFYFLY